MHFSEDELRAALRRKDPGEPFTQRVMERIDQPHARLAAMPSLSARLREIWGRRRLLPVLAAVAVAILLAGGSLGVLQYHRAQERRAGEIAKQQALLALRISSAKLNHVFKHVKPVQAR